jgi:uncharacterized delta-60 repeat protein
MCAAAQNVEWVRNYISGYTPAFDHVYDITVDSYGNSFVTGLSYGADTMGDIATIKYNTYGDTVWVRRYNGPGDNWDHSYAIAIDAAGNVYIAGKSFTDSLDYDYTVLKYNTAGALQWANHYDNANSADVAVAIAVDDEGNVYVTGYSGGIGTFYDYATIKYNASGVEQWVRRFNGIGNTKDIASDLAIDKDGNVYVTGSSGEGSPNLSDYLTIKYNSNGVQQWVANYSNLYDYATAMAVDTSGNVYVTGYSYYSGSYYDFATVKYNTFGIEQWVQRHNGILNSDDMAYEITVDYSGNVYVTGEDGGVGFTDYATIKYNTNGMQQWVAGYNGPGNAVDRAFDIVVDQTGNVFVTGESEGAASAVTDFATIMYNALGVQQWAARYNSPDNKFDHAKALGIDSAGNVYVTGRSHDINGGVFTTIKYSHTVGVEQATIVETMLHNYPNPVINSTQFVFTISEPADVNLTIYDVFGKVVALPLTQSLMPGSHRITWEPENLSDGIYFYRLMVKTNHLISMSSAGKLLLQNR